MMPTLRFSPSASGRGGRGEHAGLPEAATRAAFVEDPHELLERAAAQLLRSRRGETGGERG